jgi:hypothetical protein
MNSEMVEIGVDILPKPMVFVLGTGSELEGFPAVVYLARPVVGKSKGPLYAAGCADMIGQAVWIGRVIKLRHAILFGE